MTQQYLSEQISEILGERLRQLDDLSGRFSQFDARLGVVANELVHMRTAIDVLVAKMEGADGVEKRLRALEDDRAALRFVSHPIFVGIAMLVMGGLLTNGFNSWRQLAVLQDHVAGIEHLETYYHGQMRP